MDSSQPGSDDVDMAPTMQAPYTLFNTWERRTIVILVALAGWFSTLSSFIYYPAISAVANDLHTSVKLINLTVTSYMVVSGVAPAIVGDASDMFGRRPLYLITLALYVLANVGIALQDSFAALLVLRMLQSAAISGELLAQRSGREDVASGYAKQLQDPSLSLTA